VAWRINAWKLLTLKACVDLTNHMVSGNVCHGIDGVIRLNKVLVDQVPTKVLDSIVQAQLAGTANATFQQAAITRQGQIRELQGSVSWQQAGINVGTGWMNLGGFAADLSANGQNGLLADLRDLEGDFTIAVKADYTLGGELKMSGNIVPKPSAPQMLKDALGVYTEAQDDGSFKVTWPIGSGG
jgi:general secretion pathway protein N